MSTDRFDCHCHSPRQLTAQQLDELGRFIATYGQVTPRWIRYNLQHAHSICWAQIGAQRVGVSCLKRPRPEYLAQLSRRLDFCLDGFLERGYTCVAPAQNGRGIAAALINTLTLAAGTQPFYSLVREDSPALQKILARSGQRKLKSFYSELAEKQLGLWVSVVVDDSLSNNR